MGKITGVFAVLVILACVPMEMAHADCQGVDANGVSCCTAGNHCCSPHGMDDTPHLCSPNWIYSTPTVDQCCEFSSCYSTGTGLDILYYRTVECTTGFDDFADVHPTTCQADYGTVHAAEDHTLYYDTENLACASYAAGCYCHGGMKGQACTYHHQCDSDYCLNGRCTNSHRK